MQLFLHIRGITVEQPTGWTWMNSVICNRLYELQWILIRISYSVYTTATTKWHHCHALLYDALAQWMHGCHTLCWFFNAEMAMVRNSWSGITATLMRCIIASPVVVTTSCWWSTSELSASWSSGGGSDAPEGNDWQTDLVSWNECDLPLFAEGLRNGNCSISWRYATEFGSEHGRQKLLLWFVV